jgi:hypothetical protein
MKRKITKRGVCYLVIFFVSLIILEGCCFYERNVRVRELEGTYVCKNGAKDSLFIIVESRIFYLRKYEEREYYGYISYTDKKNSNYGVLYNWIIINEEFNRRYFHEEYGKVLFSIIRKNCNKLELVGIDPNADEIEGTGYIKISDKISGDNRQKLQNKEKEIIRNLIEKGILSR